MKTCIWLVFESPLIQEAFYTKGWPTCIPSYPEAKLLGDVRKTVAAAVGLPVSYTEPAGIIARYKYLMAVNKRPGDQTGVQMGLIF